MVILWGSQHLCQTNGAWSFLRTFHKKNSRRNFDFRFLHENHNFKPHIDKYIPVHGPYGLETPKKTLLVGPTKKTRHVLLSDLANWSFFKETIKTRFQVGSFDWNILDKLMICPLFWTFGSIFVCEARWSFTHVNVGSPDPYLPKGVTTDASLCRDLTQMMLWYWWISDFDLANRTAKRAMWNKNNLSKAAIGWKFVEKQNLTNWYQEYLTIFL